MGILLSLLPALAILLATGAPLARYRRENRRLAGQLQQSGMPCAESEKNAEEATFYRMLLESVSANIVSYDPDARIRYVNTGASKTFGIDAGEMLGKSLPELFGDDEPFFGFEKKLKRTLRHGEAAAFELELPAADGVRLHHVRLLPQRDAAGTITGAVAIGQDITERRQVDLALAAREREFRSLASMVPVAIVRFDGAGQRTYANPAADKLLGHAAPPSSHLPRQRDETGYLGLVREVLGCGVASHVEMTLRSVNGEAIWGSVSVVPEFDSMGKVAGALLVVNDITRHKRYEQVLLERAELEQRLSSYISSAPGFFFTLLRRPDGSMSLPFASPGIAAIYGLQPEEVASDVAPIIARDHPDDVPRILLEIERSGRTLTPCRAEFRVLHPEKGERWVEARSTPQRDEDGSTRWHGFMHDITERKRMEESLARSEREFRSLAENSPDIIGRFDRECRRLYANQAMAALAGKPVDALLGVPPTDGVILVDEYAEKLMAGIHDVFAVGKSARIELAALHLDGSRHEFDALLVPEHGADGKVESVLLLSRDITERKRMQEQLQKSEREFRSLAENIPDNIVRWDAQGRYLYINPTHEHTLGKSFEEVVGSCIPDSHESVKAAIKQVVASGQAMHTVRQAVIVNGIEELHDVSMVPELDEDGCVVSVLGIGRDMTAVYRMQQEVAAREREFRALVEQAPDAIVRYDRELRRVYINPAWERENGLAAGAALGKRPSELSAVVSGMAQEYEAKLRSVLDSGEPCEIEIGGSDVAGNVKYFAMRVVPEFGEDGKIASLLTVANDITVRKRMEMELAESRSFLDKVIDSVSDPLFVKDRQHRWVMMNQAFCDLLGRPREQLLGKSDYDFLPEGQADVFWQKDEEVFASGETNLNEEVITDNKGALRHIQTRKTPLLVGDGQLRLVGLIRDITERKNMEDRLRHSEAGLAEAQRIGQMGSWELDLVAGALHWSEEIYRIFEIDPAQFGASYEAFLNAIHPDDRALVNDAYNESVENQEPYDIEHRLLFPDGRIKFVHECGETSYDENGRPLFSRGTVQDVTGRRKMEDALRAREQEFRALVEKSPDTIARFDRHCRRLYANAALARSVGIPVRALLGRRPSEYSALPQTLEFEFRIVETFESGREDIYEYTWPAADGSSRTSHVHLVPEFDADGEIVSVLAIGRDITELKEAERLLRESREMLRRLSERRDLENEEARKSVAWEIYDTLGQKLMALRMELVSLAGTAGAAELRPRIDRMAALASDAIGVVREVSHELRPVTLDMGLAYGLEWLADEYAKKTGKPCQVQVDDETVPVFGGQLAVEVFRIAEQALDNVAEHAEANHVALCWEHLVDCYLLEVRDDGRGFDLDSCWSHALGLLDMRERANRLGAELIILSTPGSGTLIELRIPIAVAGQMQLWSGG